MFEIEIFENFPKSIERLVVEKSALGSVQSRCLTKYLSELDVKSYIVESNYTDAGYLLDYANYYSRCHVKYEKSTHRIHYFSLDKEKLFSSIRDGVERGAFPEEVQGHYQGFVIIKPLPRTIIGRTCLRTYGGFDLASNRSRVYPLLRKYSVSLFGLGLEVDSIAFQEQDNEIAACATTAIWYALHGVPKKITTHEIPSPFEITSASSSTFIKRVTGDVTRRFPTSGLGLEQIESYLRSHGFECIICGIKSVERLQKIKDYLLSYVHAGYPMIIVGGMYVSAFEHHSYKYLGLHAVTALGYARAEKAIEGDKSIRVERLFAHDDNVGPFTSFHFEECAAGVFDSYLVNKPAGGAYSVGSDGVSRDPGMGRECEIQGYLSNKSGLPDVGVAYRKFVPGYLIIPINEKIRLPYEVVQSFASQINFAYERKKHIWFPAGESLKITWSIELTEVSNLKSDLLCAGGMTRDQAYIDLLKLPMPKYVWRLSYAALRNGDESRLVEILIDATDLLQGGGVVAIVLYDKNDGSNEFLSLIIASVREWVDKYSHEAIPGVFPILQAIRRNFAGN